MRTLAALLVLAVVLFVALVILPQLRQVPQDQPSKPSDLVGTWVVDSDAYWDKIRSIPATADAIAKLAPDVVARMKSVMVSVTAGNTCQFTTDKMIAVFLGVRHESSYKITAINGNVLTAVCVEDPIGIHPIRFTFIEDRLEIDHFDIPPQMNVFKRVR